MARAVRVDMEGIRRKKGISAGVFCAFGEYQNNVDFAFTEEVSW
jgi:hypothetical protein